MLFENFSRNVKLVRAQIQTYRFVVNTLTHCAVLPGNNFCSKNINEFKLDFILFFTIESMSHHGGIPYHLNEFYDH